MVAKSFVRRHATGVTMIGFFAGAIGLSLAPVPSWMKPTDLLEADDPAAAVVEAVFRQPASIPLPDQLEDQIQASGDPLLLDEPPDEGPTAEVPVQPEPAPSGSARPVWTMPPRPRFDRYAEALGLRAAPLVRPCRTPTEKGPDGCAERALDRFFALLDRVERDAPGAVARVIHFGDSLIASDKIADRVRRRMQERFGSAGRGFLLGKRFNQFQRGNRSGRGSDGWTLDVITSSLRRLPDRHFGFSGASFTAQGRGETLTFRPVAGSREVALYHLAHPRGGTLELSADGQALRPIRTVGPIPTGTVATRTLPEGTETLVLRSLGPGARVYGLSLEAPVPGVSWSTIGLPGATSAVWLRPDEEEFVRLLRHHGPDLAVIMLGGNDGLMLSKGRTTPEAIERDTRAFVARIRAARPDVDCLLVTPLEAVRAKAGGRLIPKPEVPTVIGVLRRVAEREGCGFWDMYASMGGKGSLERWVDARLMLGDLIHPRSRGSDLLGEMMAEAMMRAYDDRALAPESSGASKGRPSGATSNGHGENGTAPGAARPARPAP